MRLETRDFWWEPRSGTHLLGETRDPRPVTLKVGPETRDSGPNKYVGTRTQDPELQRWDLRPEPRDTYFAWDLRPEAENTYDLGHL